MARHSFYGLGHVDDLPCLHVVFVHRFKLRTGDKGLVYGHIKLKRNSFSYGISLGIAYAQGSCNISYCLLCLHGSEGNYLRNPALAILAGNIIDYLLTALITEIYINIRHADPLRIEKTLKNQIIFYRVDISYLKAVCHNGTCCRASARAYHDSVCFGIVYKIPYNQEIFHISHGFYGAKLIVKSVVKLLCRIFTVPFVKSGIAEFSKILRVVLSLRSFEFRQMVLAEFKVEIAGIGNKLSIVHRLRQICKNLSHFVLALEVELIVRKAHSVLVIQSCSRLNGQKHIVSLCILFAHVVNIVGGYQGHIEFTPQPDQVVLYGHFLFQPLILYFQIEIALSEYFQKRLCLSLCSCIVLYQQAMLNVSGKTCRKGDDSFAVFSEHIFVNPRFIVISLDISR